MNPEANRPAVVLAEDEGGSQALEEEHIQVTPPSKVRVTFYESQKPQYVTTPDSSELSFNLHTLSSIMASPEDVEKYISMNIGVDNPFRPEGELSREAENIVKKVQTGQPFTSASSIKECILEQNVKGTESSNSITNIQNSPSTTILDVQHGIIVPPASPSNVEQVMIKKKHKCHCCIVL